MPILENEGNTKSLINLKTFLQSIFEGIIVQDCSGKIIHYNQSALDILGFNEDQLIEKGFIDYLNDELNEWDKVFPRSKHVGMESLKTGEIKRDIVLRIFKPDGEVRLLSMNVVPLLKNDPLDSLLICSFRDITDSQRVLNDFKQVQLLFNISHDLMIITNQEGYFKKINPRFINVLGYGLNEIASNKFIDFVHIEDMETTQTEIQKLLNIKDTIHFINRYKTKSNEFRVFDWLVVPDSETNLIYFTARDITDYRGEELSIIHSSKMYSIGEMTCGIAYSINGQLSIIRNHVSFLLSQVDLEQFTAHELKERIKSIDDSTQKLTVITKQLISLARNIENEKIVDVPLNRILENVIGLCKERFRIHGVKLILKLEDSLIIHSRESQIAHILLTMLNDAYNNVHKFRDSWVELSGFASNGIVHVAITNSGHTSENIDLKNFNLSKKIIEENAGTITLDKNSPNTRFIIDFPEAIEKGGTHE